MTSREVKFPYDKVVEYLSFLASSARNSIEEPHIYGSFRLIDAISRFIELLRSMPGYEKYERLEELREYIEKEKYKVMGDTREYLEFLDKVVAILVEEAMRFQ